MLYMEVDADKVVQGNPARISVNLVEFSRAISGKLKSGEKQNALHPVKWRATAVSLPMLAHRKDVMKTTNSIFHSCEPKPLPGLRYQSSFRLEIFA